jgi:hypothetical protein
LIWFLHPSVVGFLVGVTEGFVLGVGAGVGATPSVIEKEIGNLLSA